MACMKDRNADCTVGPRTATKPNVDLFKKAMTRLDRSTPVAMAELLGFNPTTIRRLLDGDQNVSVDLFKALKPHVGISEALLICNLADFSEIRAIERELQAA